MRDMKKCTIGGQAVMEGVMMKAPDSMAIAVRRPDGTIDITKKALTTVKDKYPILKLPILRGIVTFGETMVLGVRSLMTSAELYGEEEEEYKPSKFETFLAEKLGKNIDDVIIYSAVIMAIVFAIGIFVFLPALASSLIRRWIPNHVAVNLLEGVIRLVIFLLYITLVSRLKDIRRVFEYHGAEHKTIHCYEHEEELTVENARKYTTLHPRCGTAFLLIVMVISIILFSFLGWQNIFIRMLSRILLLPIIAGLSYEVTRFAGKSDALFIKAIMYPGMMLQKLTTREPDDQQLEVAIRAFVEAVKGVEGEETCETCGTNGCTDSGTTTVAGKGN
ncbi:MAG: DUF1385 domain-containing protein [Bacteroidales bacterium]|nr:DUF1385 domain-containing protein [Bacteroidales bacterium]